MSLCRFRFHDPDWPHGIPQLRACLDDSNEPASLRRIDAEIDPHLEMPRPAALSGEGRGALHAGQGLAAFDGVQPFGTLSGRDPFPRHALRRAALGRIEDQPGGVLARPWRYATCGDRLELRPHGFAAARFGRDDYSLICRN